MSSKLGKFLALDGRRRKLLLSALFNLVGARRALSRKSFKELVGKLEREGGEQQQLEQGTEQAALAQDVGWAVRTAAVQLPWDSSCLVQVLAAQRMLQARRIGGVICIGAAIGETPSGADFSAHAWLVCGRQFVTGEAGHEQYTVISKFSWG